MRTPFRPVGPSSTTSSAMPPRDPSPIFMHPQSQPQNVPQQQIPLSTTAPPSSDFQPNSTPTFSAPPNMRRQSDSQPMASNPCTVPQSSQIPFSSSQSFARSPPVAVPPPPAAPLSQTPMSQSFIPPHLFASMHREPENMARSYIKRRPPPWL